MKKLTLQIKDVLGLIQFLESIETHDIKEMRTAEKLATELNDSLKEFNKERIPLQLMINEGYNNVKRNISEAYEKALAITDEETRMNTLAGLEQRFQTETQAVEKSFYEKVDTINQKTDAEVSLELSDDKQKFLNEKITEMGPRFWRDKHALVQLMEKLGMTE